MNKIAVLFPSRFRSHLLKDAFNSWKKNSVQSDIFFAFQKNDTHLKRNMEITKGYSVSLMDDIGMAAKVNKLCADNPGYDAYMILNDDQIIHTYGWDKILLDKLDTLEALSGHRLWILSWRDDVQNKPGLFRMPQTFCTKEMLSILGTYNPVGYMRHSYIDIVYQYIGDQCKLHVYMPEVYIEHKHGCSGKIPQDANYHEVINGYPEGNKQYERWVEEKGKDLVNKIQDLLYKGEIGI